MLSILQHSCSARFSKTLSNRSSVEGIWFLSIITYKYTADTCFTLLRCQRVSGGDATEFVSPLGSSCYSLTAQKTCMVCLHEHEVN